MPDEKPQAAAPTGDVNVILKDVDPEDTKQLMADRDDLLRTLGEALAEIQQLEAGADISTGNPVWRGTARPGGPTFRPDPRARQER